MDTKKGKVGGIKACMMGGDCSGCGCSCCHCGRRMKGGMGGGGVYCLGLIGAAIYFIGQATTFGAGVLGFLKALVWPVFLVYEALKVLLG
jgi:hypothetical protein